MLSTIQAATAAEAAAPAPIETSTAASEPILARPATWEAGVTAEVDRAGRAGGRAPAPERSPARSSACREGEVIEGSFRYEPYRSVSLVPPTVHAGPVAT